MNEDNFSFSKKQLRKIAHAIEEAERETSGEIRVHIDSQHRENHVERTIEVFKSLGMENTKNRNGVLFHVSMIDHNFTILGDIGITEVVRDDFWEHIKEEVIGKFKKEKYTKGLINGVKMAGKALKEHFPANDDDANELPNDITQS